MEIKHEPFKKHGNTKNLWKKGAGWRGELNEYHLAKDLAQFFYLPEDECLRFIRATFAMIINYVRADYGVNLSRFGRFSRRLRKQSADERDLWRGGYVLPDRGDRIMYNLKFTPSANYATALVNETDSEWYSKLPAKKQALYTRRAQIFNAMFKQYLLDNPIDEHGNWVGFKDEKTLKTNRYIKDSDSKVQEMYRQQEAESNDQGD